MNTATQANLTFYDSFAPLYPAIFSLFDTGAIVDQWVRFLEEQGFIPNVDQRALKRPKLLDAACGPGNFLAAWSAASFEVSGADDSPAMLRLAADEWKRVRPQERPRLFRMNLCQPESMERLRASFDLAVSHSHLPNLFHPEDLPALFQSVANCLKNGGFWAADHSRIVSSVPRGEDRHAIDPTRSLLRVCEYDEANRECHQVWTGDGFEGRETYWFPEIDTLDKIALHAGLMLRRRMEWMPNQVTSPFIPMRNGSERLFSVYQRQS